MLLANTTSDKLFDSFIASQIYYETQADKEQRKTSGTFFTNDLYIVDQVINVIGFDETIFSSKILDPSCGYGIFVLRLIFKVYCLYPSSKYIDDFIKNNLFFIDIDHKMIQKTKENIGKLYQYLFAQKYTGIFNSFCYDFTYKANLHQSSQYNVELSKLYGEIDYIIGNPPYITLYGRRDRKKSESQREYYLHHYFQFPKCVKNGKLNYVMLFLEHSVEFLKYNGRLSFIIDISFFETAYTYTRKFLLENTQIDLIIYNLKSFEVASGQLVLRLTRKLPLAINGVVEVIDAETQETRSYYQSNWYRDDDEYKFRIFSCEKSVRIIEHIAKTAPTTLKELYPQKNLRTCAMLLDMEDKFVFSQANLNLSVSVYPYYRGSKSLKQKFGRLEPTGFFYYDKELQDAVNERLKQQLIQQGIKNKKRIGLGEKIIYDYPKIYIRQSAKSIIATYDNNHSAANNSLYVFTLRDNSDLSLRFLKFLCAYLNSDLLTFFCQKQQIIRYSKGKQPQIKISDLYSIPIPLSDTLISTLATLTDSFYSAKQIDKMSLVKTVNDLVYDYYEIESEDIIFIQESIKCF